LAWFNSPAKIYQLHGAKYFAIETSVRQLSHRALRWDLPNFSILRQLKNLNFKSLCPMKATCTPWNRLTNDSAAANAPRMTFGGETLQVLNTSALAALQKQRNHAQHKYVKFCGIKQPRRAIKIIAAITAFGCLCLSPFQFRLRKAGEMGKFACISYAKFGCGTSSKRNILTQ